RLQGLAVDAEAGDVRRAARVQDVERLLVDGDADRVRAAGGRVRLPDEAAVVVHGEHRDRVARRVDGEQALAVLAEDDRALGAEAGAAAVAAGREGAGRGQRAGGGV